MERAPLEIAKHRGYFVSPRGEIVAVPLAVPHLALVARDPAKFQLHADWLFQKNAGRVIDHLIESGWVHINAAFRLYTCSLLRCAQRRLSDWGLALLESGVSSAHAVEIFFGAGKWTDNRIRTHLDAVACGDF